MIEPIHCPFCGGQAVSEQDVDNKLTPLWWLVGCAKPECPGVAFAAYERHGDAIKAWNTRAQPTPNDTDRPKEPLDARAVQLMEYQRAAVQMIAGHNAQHVSCIHLLQVADLIESQHAELTALRAKLAAVQRDAGQMRETFGAIVVDVLQGDYTTIEAFAQSARISFASGEPVLAASSPQAAVDGGEGT